MYPNLIKENRRMSTCNRLDLQTLASQLIMPKNLPDHCLQLTFKYMGFGICHIHINGKGVCWTQIHGKHVFGRRSNPADFGRLPLDSHPYIHGTSVLECWFLAVYLKLCTIAKKFISSDPHLGRPLSGHCFPDPSGAQGPRFFPEFAINGQRPVVLDLVTGKLTEFQAPFREIEGDYQIVVIQGSSTSWESMAGMCLHGKTAFGCSVWGEANLTRIFMRALTLFTKEYSRICCVDLNCKDSNHIMLIHDMSTKTQRDIAPNGVAPLY